MSGGAGGEAGARAAAGGRVKRGGDQPVEYVVGHVEDALARDPRVIEQGLRVALGAGGLGGAAGREGGEAGAGDEAAAGDEAGSGLVVVITGTVATARHKAAITDVVRSVVPGVRVRNETTVADYPEPSPSQAEELG